ncbi:unnamed protein product [Lasius platythorax]|uniref:Uncharacterized protein n=1 Tax=Lasius platythorax TaxID=488582 RepID=A0AAV2P9L5_9HYME
MANNICRRIRAQRARSRLFVNETADTLPHAAGLHKDDGKRRMTMTKTPCCFHRLFTLVRGCILVRTCDCASRECTCRPYGHA